MVDEGVIEAGLARGREGDIKSEEENEFDGVAEVLTKGEEETERDEDKDKEAEKESVGENEIEWDEDKVLEDVEETKGHLHLQGNMGETEGVSEFCIDEEGEVE